MLELIFLNLKVLGEGSSLKITPPRKDNDLKLANRYCSSWSLGKLLFQLLLIKPLAKIQEKF